MIIVRHLFSSFQVVLKMIKSTNYQLYEIYKLYKIYRVNINMQLNTNNITSAVSTFKEPFGMKSIEVSESFQPKRL